MKRHGLYVLIVLCALGLIGCGTNSQNAYPTAQTLANSGAAHGADEATLATGRKIFTTTCTECHVARSMAQFSIAQWRHILNEMAPRAGLKPSDRAALEAYLVAARVSMPPG